ncbi:hypothetical protein BME96_18910 (plasmid) [Virgibacillus halodenitrificans]|uniref:Uncharacterized protein n=1 Tax=Virgibacillus halodenitrificans TaxID=1482 RepID=A0AAC9J7X7_VIRHA|nr:MobP2 family relaxase [Virgibacillus halodenitrificans]APC50354.1 hypothetical protein BME96_18910 [Virgibacillus halodenitrificans]AVD54443.1 hypothetical protein CKF96_02720 [Priestia filamentosa]
MGKPSVILTSQFTTPEAKSFSNYLKYMTRKEALKEKETALSNRETVELDKLENVIETFEMKMGSSIASTQSEELTKKEEEALTILKKPEHFIDNEETYSKYINYMGRHYALEKKENPSIEEEKEKSVVRKKIFKMVGINETEELKHPDIKQGVFSIDKEIMTTEDMKKVNKIVKHAQKNGSVFYQDVISFDTDFLIREGIYNPKKDYLDEHRIQNASRKMMKKMFEDEKIESGYWFASIHRNTDHIHVHYGTVETKNTRQLVSVKEDGVEYLAPKGKRKQQTIDNMKSTFANSLIERTAELTRISDLRNTLVQDIKEAYGDRKNKKELKLLQEIYKELPSNKKHWQYGSKYVSIATREKIDKLTESMMKGNSDYKEYFKKTEEESFYRKELFGDSTRSDKDYAANKKQEIDKRLGNSLLKEMKKGASRTEANRNVFAKERQQIKRSSKNKMIFVTSGSINKIRRVVNNDYEKFRAEREYEQTEEKIKREQERNRI